MPVESGHRIGFLRRQGRNRTGVPRTPRATVVAVLSLLAAGCGDDHSKSGGALTGPDSAIPTHSLRVVYTAGGDEVFHLWTMTAGGDDPVQLTFSDGAEATPAWSPDGTQIAFAAADNRDDDFDLWVIGADGSGLRQLTNTDDLGESVPSWSPDGTRIAYSQNTLDDEGASIRILVVDDPRAEGLRVADGGDWPSWSPDGRTILYTGDNAGTEQPFTVPAAGGAATMLEPEGTSSAYEAAWSPDGTEIAFVSTSGDGEAADPATWNEDIWVMAADGTGARKVVSTAGNDHWAPTWSPNGRQLIYTADGLAKEGEISRVNLASGKVTALTENDFNDMMPNWRHGT